MRLRTLVSVPVMEETVPVRFARLTVEVTPPLIQALPLSWLELAMVSVPATRGLTTTDALEPLLLPL
ncbi:MAG: hypothetical protein NTW19_21465 [Planctomycetota bacterium]|nr:hypothetical protein [Planctomycetota bacterium]